MRLITAQEVAAMLNVSVNWVNDRVRSRTKPEDRIPHIKLGRNVRFMDTDVEEWLRGQRTKSAVRRFGLSKVVNK
jgi:excisionase family DNA binding protein